MHFGSVDLRRCGEGRFAYSFTLVRCGEGVFAAVHMMIIPCVQMKLANSSLVLWECR